MEDIDTRVKNLNRRIKNTKIRIGSIDPEKNAKELKSAKNTLSNYKWEKNRLLNVTPEEATKIEEQRLSTNRNFKYKDKEKEAAYKKRRAEQKKKWRMKNIERVNKQSRAWKRRNRERVNKQNREWKRKNRAKKKKEQESLQDNPTPERKTPGIIQPSPVETLPPPTPLTTDKGYLQADEKLRHAEPFRWVDLTGQLLQNLDDPFVRDLQRTEMGRLALQVEREHGGKLFLTNGAASFHYKETTVIGLGPKFTLSARFAQQRWIHEKMHQLLRDLNPLKYTQKEYVELMLQEEAYVESCGIDHIRELGPERPLTLSDSIYIEAFDQGYRDMKMIKLWATEEELRVYGRQRGMEALLQALKDKVLVPSTVSQDLSRSKEQLYGYQEYYAEQWQGAWDGQKATVINPAPALEANPAMRPPERMHDLE